MKKEELIVKIEKLREKSHLIRSSSVDTEEKIYCLGKIMAYKTCLDLIKGLD